MPMILNISILEGLANLQKVEAVYIGRISPWLMGVRHLRLLLGS